MLPAADLVWKAQMVLAESQQGTHLPHGCPGEEHELYHLGLTLVKVTKDRYHKEQPLESDFWEYEQNRRTLSFAVVSIHQLSIEAAQARPD